MTITFFTCAGVFIIISLFHIVKGLCIGRIRSRDGSGSECLKKREIIEMTCKSFSGMVPAFLNDTLDNRSLKEFLEHHRSCETCREEVEIQYLVEKAFNDMDVGEEINLSRDLPAYIEKEANRLRVRERLRITAIVMEIAAVTAAAVTVFWFFA